nr:MAG TPA: minor capsid protein [Caudoviricetes sp.]
MNEYDIGKAFERIENELIRSMIRNLDRHRAEETELGYNWEQWQVKQLQALEEYKKANRKQFKGRFRRINASIDGLISLARQEGNMSQEKAILEAIKKGYRPRTFKDLFEKYKGKNIREIMDLILRKNIQSEINGEFFKLNDRKMAALIRATKRDFQKAEHAILRMAEDQYRKIIFDAQVYANTGSATYEKAVDMATKDFLSRGINCIEYSNGARHTVADYAYMAIQTACKRAYLTGEGEKRKEWGISTVIMNKRGNPCPKCLPFVGKVLIDDVWSGGSKEDGDYPLMSQAIAKGLYHPRCKDSHTTYFEGISTTPDDIFTKKELNEIEKNTKEEIRRQYVKRQIKKYSRLEENSLDKENKEKYGVRKNQWQNVRFRTGGIDNKEYMMTKRPLAKFKAVSQMISRTLK